MVKQNFRITGMTCNHCVEHVQDGINSLTGVKKVKVNLKKGEGTVKYDEKMLSAQDIVNKVEEVGYEAQVI